MYAIIKLLIKYTSDTIQGVLNENVTQGVGGSKNLEIRVT